MPTIFTNDQIKKVLLGNGDFRAGTPLSHLGPIKGNFVIDITRALARFKAGVPQILYKQLATDEEVFAKGTYASLDLNIVQEALGLGAYAAVTAGSTPVTATVTFNDTDPSNIAASPINPNTGNIGQLLGYQDLLTSPTPVVQDTTTLANYPASAYTIDYTFGMITRTLGSTIPIGGTVNVFFTYTAVAAESYSFGGLIGVGYVPAQFIHTRADGKRVICHMWRASTNGRLLLEFRETEWNLFDIQFNLIADIGRPAGAMYFKVIRET